MTVALSNAETDLADRLGSAVHTYQAAERAAGERALEAGALLCQARALVAHGRWGAFLSRAGVHERQAQRLMQLSSSGLKSDTVSYLGGVKAALQYLARLRSPIGDNVVVAWRQGSKEPPLGPFAALWRTSADCLDLAVFEETAVLTPRRGVYAWGAGLAVSAALSCEWTDLVWEARPQERAFWRDLLAEIVP